MLHHRLKRSTINWNIGIRRHKKPVVSSCCELSMDLSQIEMVCHIFRECALYFRQIVLSALQFFLHPGSLLLNRLP